MELIQKIDFNHLISQRKYNDKKRVFAYDENRRSLREIIAACQRNKRTPIKLSVIETVVTGGKHRSNVYIHGVQGLVCEEMEHTKKHGIFTANFDKSELLPVLLDIYKEL